MALLDIAIILAFIIYAISSGFRSKNEASKNLEEYFLAGRSLSGWKAGLSMAATQFAADTPLLVTGLIATAGIFALWQMWIYALAFLLMGFVLAPCWRRASVLTDAELTELRYGQEPAAFLRVFKAFYFGTVFNCIVLAWVFFAAAKIAEPFLVWNEWLPASIFQIFLGAVKFVGVKVAIHIDAPDAWINTANNMISIIAILLVTTLYSATGGLRSVVATDVVQFGIMMAGTLTYAWIVVDEAGGMGAITDKIYENFQTGGPKGIKPEEILAFTPDLAFNAGWAVIFLFGLQWLIQLNSDGTGYLAQRSMACKSEKDAKVAAIVFTFAQIFLRSLLWLPIGLGLLIIFPPDLSLSNDLITAKREATFVLGIEQLLPVGIKGLMLTGMLAALASTVDTHLNWGSSYWTNDIYKRFICQGVLKKEPHPRTLVWVARGANLLILGISLFVMTKLDSIQKTWQISLLLGAGMGVVLILRWIWWRMNAWAEIAAIVSSLIAAYPLMTYIPDANHALRLLLIAIITTIAALIAIWVKGPEQEERLNDFYQRVHPPGFWYPVAQRLGLEEEAKRGPLRLAKGLGAVAICALSFFCLLVGIGSWLVGSPVPYIIKAMGIAPIVWCIGLIIVGFLLIPLWYRLGFRTLRPFEYE